VRHGRTVFYDQHSTPTDLIGIRDRDLQVAFKQLGPTVAELQASAQILKSLRRGVTDFVDYQHVGSAQVGFARIVRRLMAGA
jgi:hypothetical protein